MLKEKGFWKGFVAALGLVVALSAVPVLAKGQGGVIIDRREALALEAIATQLIAIREEGVKVNVDKNQTIPVELKNRQVEVKMDANDKVKVEVTNAIPVKNDFGSQFEVKQR